MFRPLNVIDNTDRGSRGPSQDVYFALIHWYLAIVITTL